MPRFKFVPLPVVWLIAPDRILMKAAAKKISEVTGGKLDCLIHNAARTDLGGINKGYNDL